MYVIPPVCSVDDGAGTRRCCGNERLTLAGATAADGPLRGSQLHLVSACGRDLVADVKSFVRDLRPTSDERLARWESARWQEAESDRSGTAATRRPAAMYRQMRDGGCAAPG